MERPFGEVFTLEEIEKAVKTHKPQVVGIVHAETSTGACQPMEGIAKIVHDAGAVLIMDCVTSLGGRPVCIDEWGVDAAYSGTQKCLSCPPGLSPLTFGHGVGTTRCQKDQGAVVVSRPEHGSQLLGRVVASLSSHRTDQHELRAARSAANRLGGRPGSSLC